MQFLAKSRFRVKGRSRLATLCTAACESATVSSIAPAAINHFAKRMLKNKHASLRTVLFLHNQIHYSRRGGSEWKSLYCMSYFLDSLSHSSLCTFIVICTILKLFPILVELELWCNKGGGRLGVYWLASVMAGYCRKMNLCFLRILRFEGISYVLFCL